MDNNDLFIIQDHIRIGKGMGLTNGVPEALERLVEQLQLTEKALVLACDFISEETDICLWDESDKFANEYGGYDCDLCPRYPIEKCTKNYFLHEAKQMLANENGGDKS